ncbi:MAG: pyridoxamine 5'-phosphate oxidase family protein [Beijerinckiaceae bacterium]|nr:pyridoxamine 5'-phosphate oxidase family protein [Beijerinckiaceae bacterium]
MSAHHVSYYDDLDASLAEAWKLIGRGAVDRRHGFHHPTLATIGADGSPEARTVILRASDAVSRTIVFHTDARSKKVAEITANPVIALHFYDSGQKIQLRISGEARLHAGDEFARRRWSASQPMSRLCYSVAPGPGEPIEAPDGYAMQDRETLAAEGFDGDAFRHFVAVETHVRSIEWLYLALEGHRRASFRWLADGSLAKSWLTP